MKNRVLEIFFGGLIILGAVVFIVYASFVVMNSSMKTYQVSAIFTNVGSLVNGSHVSIYGVNIGTVYDISLNKDYNVVVAMDIADNIKIPEGSFVTINASGVFDSPEIIITPSKSTKFVNAGDVLKNTKDWVSLDDRIGSIFLNMKD